ncbi:dipeptide/oligopeptide/nickel ABC transporter permease/ATP-binding protein [Pseudonocardia sp. GCM10023141]|uniref:dipeptide/oligopeptide/nickel ABC transporter permease/ATP-binding protein n=1 Tax=Pseudonocardia sp. GCM10023141 TaxID=3252653 RepID=UPI0036095454
MTSIDGAATPGSAPPNEVDPPRLLRRVLRRPLAIVCLAYLLLIVAVGIIAPIALPGVAVQNAGELLSTLKGPSAAHLLGTDTLGRDVLDRLLVGTGPTLLGVAEALVAVLVLGVPLGLVAGFFGRRIDAVISWLADLTFSIPSIVVILVVLSAFRHSMTAAMISFGVLTAPSLMRVVRSATVAVRSEPYIAAAQVSGLSRGYIVVRHVLPRIAGPIIVQASLIASFALVVQTGLSFLGLIVDAPAPSWGGMVADGIKAIVLQPWLIWPAGIAIVATGLALGLLADIARDATTEGWSPQPARRRPVVPVATPLAASAGDPPARDALLSIRQLGVAFASAQGLQPVLDDVNLDLRAGECVGLVGESGCGKSITAMSVLGLLPANGRVTAGSIWFEGRDLTTMPERELRRLRGKEIGLISQEPMISLDPAFRIGWQLAEAIRQHHGCTGREARTRAVGLLESVRLPRPAEVARKYPHELSGGMAQRVAIARALAGEPKLLIADEPTTALDVTVQAEILDLLRDIRRDRNMAVLLVTHDWGVVADSCDRAVVMYAGQVVEQGSLQAMFREPLHPYTDALLAANPHNAIGAGMLPTISGTVPKPGQWPAGCHFHPRCPYATAACRDTAVALLAPAEGRLTRCIHHDLLAARKEGVLT